jgi:hypothetical protein
MNRSESIVAISAAMVKVQKEIRNPTFDKKNGFFKDAPYASLSAVIDSCRLVLATHGCFVAQPVSCDTKMVTVETIITHTSGEWMSCSASGAIPEKGGIQAFGSIVTYLRRYCLSSFLCLAGDTDDDGNADLTSRSDSKVKMEPKLDMKSDKAKIVSQVVSLMSPIPTNDTTSDESKLIPFNSNVVESATPKGESYWTVDAAGVRYVIADPKIREDYSYAVAKATKEGYDNIRVVCRPRPNGRASIIVAV